jgi:hypothetical protein
MAVNTVARKKAVNNGAVCIFNMPRAIILIQTDVQTLFTPMHDFEMSEFSVILEWSRFLLPPGAFLRDGTAWHFNTRKSFAPTSHKPSPPL